MARTFLYGILIWLLNVLLWTNPAAAGIALAGIFSDNMVLQAQRPVRIWGTAAANEPVAVFINELKKTTRADKNGKWQLEFPAMDYGKVIDLRATGRHNELRLTNILTGDVWLCSGQSNMAMTVNGTEGQIYNYKNEESTAGYPAIRSFKVKPNLSVKTGVDVAGHWEVCTPQTVGQFSAVAYFFARKIHQETGIPIGIINASWGGTDIETWMSADAFTNLPEYFEERYKEVASMGIDAVLKRNYESSRAFNEKVANDEGSHNRWFDPGVSKADWKQMEQPQEWSGTELAAFDGVAWFSYDIRLQDNEAGLPATLSLGKIDDNEITWINGTQVGATNGAGYERVYHVPAGILKAGVNTIIVKVVDAIRGGGFTGTAADLYLKTARGAYTLAGSWKYRTSVEAKDPYYGGFEPNLYHSLLYNAMIDPLKNFAIKGVAWYQGENNAGKAFDYRTLFPALIQDWRKKWGCDFPFYWVQLAGFMPKAVHPPVADSWAELREAQTMTLAVKNTGQAIATDIGDAHDIHPRNKQDVGLRLALNALSKTYNRKQVFDTGPVYAGMKRQGKKVVVEFDNVGSGLLTTSKYGYVEGFAVAGADRKFVWARAKITGPNRVELYTDKVVEPVAARYCWEANPDVNLYNSAGLPAGPFRTDNWKLSSQK